MQGDGRPTPSLLLDIAKDSWAGVDVVAARLVPGLFMDDKVEMYGMND